MRWHFDWDLITLVSSKELSDEGITHAKMILVWLERNLRDPHAAFRFPMQRVLRDLRIAMPQFDEAVGGLYGHDILEVSTEVFMETDFENFLYKDMLWVLHEDIFVVEEDDATGM